MNIEDFKKLGRDEMVAEIIKVSPAAIKGKTRAKKEVLIDLFTSLSTSKGDVEAPPGIKGFNDVIQRKAADMMDDLTGVTEEVFLKTFNAMLSVFDQDTQVAANAARIAHKALNDGQNGDPYKLIAAACFNVKYEQITPSQRDTVKSRTFAVLYGSPTGRHSSATGELSLSGRLPSPPQDPGRAEPVGEQVMVDTDYAGLEARTAAVVAEDLSQLERQAEVALQQGVDAEALKAVERYVDEGLSLSSGVDSAQMGPPIGVALKKSRRQILVEALNGLAQGQLRLIAHYKSLLPTNRKNRRLKDALKTRIGKFLPRGVTLDEAMAVIN